MLPDKDVSKAQVLMTARGQARSSHRRKISRRPVFRLTSNQRAGIVGQFGHGLASAQKSARRQRLVLRLSLELKRAAERFCRHVALAERPIPDSKTGLLPRRQAPLPAYKDAGALLRTFLQGRIRAGDVCSEVNRQLANVAVVWELKAFNAGSPRSRLGSRFVLERGEGASDAWRELAILLGHGATLGRMRVCALPTCGRLFYDASPPAKRSTCSAAHKHILASRRYRQAHRGPTRRLVRRARRRTP
jgi:hypothetical protein